jgi:acetylornithine/N-succinyldiaminopimelate aminotransferase
MHSLNRSFYNLVAQTSDAPLGIQITHAHGVWMFDEKGEKYLDCISGISVSNLGHSNPLIIHAIKQQVDKHMHLMVYGEIIQSSQVLLAEKLNELLPERLNNVYFVNSGSEAVEGAMKLAKRYTGRHRFVALEKAYHGSSHGALSLMSDEYFQHKFTPLLPGIDFLKQDDLNAIEQLLTTETAAVFIEPIMAEKGYLPCSIEFLNAVKNRCQETGTLLIFDEIQSGMGRTGDFFAFQDYQIVPDILLLAKAFGGGMPLGAFISSSEIMSCLMNHPVLGHITTFGGHPVSCSASLAAIEYIENNNILKSIREKEKLFRELLHHPKIKTITGKGLMLAIDLQDPIFCRRVIDQCVKDGLLIDWFLYAEHKIRLSPPLIISDEEIQFVCEIILKNLNE